MKRVIIFFVLIGSITLTLISNNLPDFKVTDILVNTDKFIYIKINNDSNFNFQIRPKLNEIIFLTIYINKIKRAEYKLKYIDKKLFLGNSTIFFETNFRAQHNLSIKVEINKVKVIPELNYLNNSMEKILDNNAKR